jgi:hypothetical protein
MRILATLYTQSAIDWVLLTQSAVHSMRVCDYERQHASGYNPYSENT